MHEAILFPFYPKQKLLRSQGLLTKDNFLLAGTQQAFNSKISKWFLSNVSPNNVETRTTSQDISM